MFSSHRGDIKDSGTLPGMATCVTYDQHLLCQNDWQLNEQEVVSVLVYKEFQLYRIHKTVLMWAGSQVSLPLSTK